MLKVRIYSRLNNEQGVVICESLSFAGREVYITNPESIDGSADILNINNSDSYTEISIPMPDIISVSPA